VRERQVQRERERDRYSVRERETVARKIHGKDGTRVALHLTLLEEHQR
jgi:hypothetical protein